MELKIMQTPFPDKKYQIIYADLDRKARFMVYYHIQGDIL